MKIYARGFTLLELLIALTLLSLMLVILYGGLNLGMRTWEVVERTTQRTEDLRLARGLLQRILWQARRMDWPLEQQRVGLFWGDAEQLELIAPLPGFVGIGGLYLLRFALVHHGNQRDLVIQRWLLHPDITVGNRAIPAWRPLERQGRIEVPYDGPLGLYGTSLLLPNVDELSFRFYGAGAHQGEAEWLEEWKERTTPPNLVSIHLGAGWPDLIVAVGGAE